VATGSAAGRVNLHVDAMRALGAEIEYPQTATTSPRPGPPARRADQLPADNRHGHRECHARGLPGDGHTVIEPAAQEPEVDDLIAFLQKMGAQVERTAPNRIEIEGRRRLRGADHSVVPEPDRDGTFIIAAAVTRGR